MYVLKAIDLVKSYGGRRVVDHVSFDVAEGQIVGLLGRNGAGKTTLFRMVTGVEAPDEGAIRIGETVDLAYIEQDRDDLNPGKTIWEVISDGEEMLDLGGRDVNSRAYVARFNFTGGDQQKLVNLSLIHI